MKQFLQFILFFIISTTMLFAQGGATTCAELQINSQLYQSCATSVPFANQTATNIENIFPSCFQESIKAPTWFFIKIKNSGTINLQISQISNLGNGIDVDFCLWGPFTSVNNVCSQLTVVNEADCSWLPANVENVTISNAVQNQIYILLVDNFAQLPGTISIAQTGGSGSSDCSFLSSVAIKDTNNNEIIQLEYCKPASKVLKAVVDVTDFNSSPSDLRFNYRWTKDGVVVQTISNSILNSNNLNTSLSGTYKVEIAVYDITDTSINISNIPFPLDQSDEIDLKFFDTAVLTNSAINIEQCDFATPNNDGIAVFNLTQYYNQITNSIPGIELKYYKNAALTQEILNPAVFTNTIPFNQTVYVVGKIESNPIDCFSNTAILNLKIIPTSTATYPDILAVCATLNQNYGFIDFESQRINIKNTFFPLSTVEIQFYLTAIDASLELNQLQNTSQLPVGSRLIYAKIKSGNICSGVGTFLIIIKSSPVLNTISTVNICKRDTFILNSKDAEAVLSQINTVEVSYFSSFENAKNNLNFFNKNIPFPLNVGQYDIFVRIFDIVTQCFSIVKFQLNVIENPILNNNPATYAICGNTTGTFNLNSRLFDLIGNNAYTVRFFETIQDLNNNTAISNPNSYSSISKTIFVKAFGPSPTNCASQTALKLEVNPKPGNSVHPSPFLICENSGFSTFDLTSKELEMAGVSIFSGLEFKYYEKEIDALMNNNSTISNPQNYTNQTKNFQKIYVRVNNLNPVLFCFSILEISIFVSEFPKNNFDTKPYKICLNPDGSVAEEAFVDSKLIPSDYDFLWFNNFDALSGNELSGQTNSTFSTPNEGNFSVKIISKLTPARCTTIANFSTKNLIIPRTLKFSPNNIISFSGDNTILAIANPPSDEYEYLLNYGNWQSDNNFTIYKEGINVIKVRNKFGCNTIENQFLVANFAPFFTPNSDGYNDFWKIEGDAAIDITNTYIYDQFGKLLYEHKKSSQGWDGTFQGQQMPANDYWFRIIYTNKNESKEFRSHFSLKR